MKSIVRAMLKLNPRKNKQTPKSLPAELWTLDFEDDVLERSDILRLRLTCYTFAKLANPMIFRCVGLDFTGKIIKDYASRLASKLIFLLSEDIAPHIQELSITFGAANESHQAMFFGALARCINLSHLRCKAVQFDDYAIGSIWQLKNSTLSYSSTVT